MVALDSVHGTADLIIAYPLIVLIVLHSLDLLTPLRRPIRGGSENLAV